MNNLIINEIEAIDEVVNESKIDQLMTIASIYDKQFTIIEEYQYRNKSDVSGFKIFQESFYQEGEILDKATGKGKDESILAKIVAFIPRLVGAIIDSIKKLFSGDSKKKAEAAAEKASKLSPQKLATVGGILGAAGLGFIGGKVLSNNSKEDPETAKKNEELTKANQDLTEKNTKLNETNTKLNETNKNLTDENNNLKTSIAEKDKQFEEEMNKLKEQIKSLSESNLAKENEKLKKVKEALIKQVRAASTENREKRDRDVREAQKALYMKTDQWEKIRREYLQLKKSHDQLQNKHKSVLDALSKLKTDKQDMVESLKTSPFANDATVLHFIQCLNDTIENLAYDKKIANTTLRTRTKELENTDKKLKDTEKERDDYKKKVEEASAAFDKIKAEVIKTFAKYKSEDNEKENQINALEAKIEQLNKEIQNLKNIPTETDDDDEIENIFTNIIDENKDDTDGGVVIPVNTIVNAVTKTDEPKTLKLVADIVTNAAVKSDSNQDKKTPAASNDNLKKLGSDVDTFSKRLSISIDNLSQLGNHGTVKQHKFYQKNYMSDINRPFIFNMNDKKIYSKVNFELLIENINIISELVKANFDDSAIKKTITPAGQVVKSGEFIVYKFNKDGVNKIYKDFETLNNSLTKINSAVKGIANDKYDEKKKRLIKNINQILTNYTVIIDNLCKVFNLQMQALDQAVK